jgi:hypothetical protein
MNDHELIDAAAALDDKTKELVKALANAGRIRAYPNDLRSMERNLEPTDANHAPNEAAQAAMLVAYGGAKPDSTEEQQAYATLRETGYMEAARAAVTFLGLLIESGFSACESGKFDRDFAVDALGTLDTKACQLVSALVRTGKVPVHPEDSDWLTKTLTPTARGTARDASTWPDKSEAEAAMVTLYTADPRDVDSAAAARAACDTLRDIGYLDAAMDAMRFMPMLLACLSRVQPDADFEASFAHLSEGEVEATADGDIEPEEQPAAGA